MSFCRVLALCIGMSMAAPIGMAMEISPFAIQNQIPLVQIFGLPAPGSPTVIGKGRSILSVREDISSNFAVKERRGEKITIDGESYRTTLGFRYGVASGIETFVEIPFIGYSGGFLDWFIDDFHHTFGFGDGDRNMFPRDRLLISYARNGEELVRLDQSGAGIGDVAAGVGVQIIGGSDSGTAVTLSSRIKFPTGSSKSLRGSGSTDFALWLTGKTEVVTGSGRFGLFAAGGGMYLTKGDILPEMQRDLVAFGSVGAGWSPVRWLAVKVQLDGNSPFYKNTALRPLKAGFSQAFGFSFGLPGGFELDVAATEDLVVLNASPDVVFHLALRKNF